MVTTETLSLLLVVAVGVVVFHLVFCYDHCYFRVVMVGCCAVLELVHALRADVDEEI